MPAASNKAVRQASGPKTRQLPPSAGGQGLQQPQGQGKGMTAPTPLKPTDVGVEWLLDQQGNPTDQSTEVPAAEVFEPEEFVISWQEALEIHNQRMEAEKGRPLAASTIGTIQGVRIGVPAPGNVVVNDDRA